MGFRVSEVGIEVSNAVGRLYIVATPIGNRDDITSRAVEILRSVDRVVAEDTRHSGRLLAHLAINRPMMSLHEHNETDAGQRVIGYLLMGESLALISDAGTPLISDPGYPLVRACREQGIEVVPVPGASALIAALSVSGLPTDRFRFEGFLPRRQQARLAHLETLRRETATLIFYESSHRVTEALRDLVAVFGPARPAVLARELTKLHETVRSASLAGLLDWVMADENQRKGELVLMLAGAEVETEHSASDIDNLLTILLEELPLKQAAHLAARISGEKKNLLYQRALVLAGH
jgi:16S rRNA (cytidine1402-2'-O)-methyltransferase